MTSEIKHIDFAPLINLDKQNLDPSILAGTHWEEKTSPDDQHNIKSVLIAEDKNLYYLPLSEPYVIQKEWNKPDYSFSPYQNEQFEIAFELQYFLPNNSFMPYMEFIEAIPAENWVNAYIEIIKNDPSLIESLFNFSFYLTDDKYIQNKMVITHKEYDHYIYICYPFRNIVSNNGKIEFGHQNYFNLKNYTHDSVACEKNNIVCINPKYKVIYSNVLPIIVIPK